jgi:glutathione S-transferase
MSITLYGFPQSSYLRTARMVCEEKGVAYELVPLRAGSDEILARHPFGRVPAMQHGDVRLFETSAIARYVDEVFPGPSLVPSTAIERAAMEQWISTVNAYLFDDIVRKYVFAYIFPKGPENRPDRTAIEAALPSIRRDLGLIDKALGRSEWIAGKTISLADLFLAPILFYASMFPEGMEILSGLENLKRGGAQMRARESFQKTMPPPMPA